MKRQPLAERFVADEDAFIQDPTYQDPTYQGRITKGSGNDLEVAFPDGSVAHCRAGDWRVGPLLAEDRM
jgi:hypothetical protein